VVVLLVDVAGGALGLEVAQRSQQKVALLLQGGPVGADHDRPAGATPRPTLAIAVLG
jgi:hypothetical protein